jgi:hypothetical protein
VTRITKGALPWRHVTSQRDQSIDQGHRQAWLKQVGLSLEICRSSQWLHRNMPVAETPLNSFIGTTGGQQR